MRSACFATNSFEDAAAANCFSNLLEVEFRRFVVDVYYDSTRNLWSLCPVQLGVVDGTAQGTSAAVKKRQATSSSSSIPLSTTSSLGQTSASQTASTETASSLQSATQSTNVASSTISSSLVSSTSPNSENQTVYQVGPYSCTHTVTLDLLCNVLAGHIKATSDHVNATVKYIILNLHAAASASDPTGSPQEPSLDNSGVYSETLSIVINETLADYIYTPIQLAEERADINSSWYSVPFDDQPIAQYLQTSPTIRDDVSSPQGWPSEIFVEFVRFKRLLVGIGSIDPQMSTYNLTGDLDSIFAPGVLTADHDVSLATDGQLNTGCIFDSSDTSVFAVNGSWATTSNVLTSASPLSLDESLVAASNLTSCGISPFLNQTLSKTTADIDAAPYASFVQSSIWSWYPGSPSDDQSETALESSNHCAVLSTALSGHWTTADCSKRHYGACRVGNQPYEWTVSSQTGEYDNVDDSCPSNSTFAVPRTALENSYLHAAIQSHISSGAITDTGFYWVDFNDADVAGCWVSGVNGTCPYVSTKNPNSRKISVSAVAGVIVFVLAALTIFVKCTANRRSLKRTRKRGNGGWDYEGVPS